MKTCLLLCFEAGSPWVALAGLELIRPPDWLLAPRSACFCFPSAKVKGATVPSETSSFKVRVKGRRTWHMRLRRVTGKEKPVRGFELTVEEGSTVCGVARARQGGDGGRSSCLWLE